MVHFKTTFLAVALLWLVGCVDQGRPLVSERSPVFDEPNPSVMPETTKAEPQARRTPSRVPAIEVNAPDRSDREPPRVKVFAPQQYIVRRGESLYAIAWRFELDHAAIAKLNDIRPPYVIHPGQVLNLRSRADRTAVAKSKPPPQQKSSPPTVVKPKTRPPRTATQAAAPKPRIIAGGWQWPVDGKPQRGYGKGSIGVDFLLSEASGVRACNGGEVVYAGNGIAGFAHLVIVRHDQELLSAYSFNGTTRVAEGDVVKAGQKIADIQNIGQASQKLHFELRKKGLPINPGTMIK